MVPSQTDSPSETASVVITGAGLVTSLGLNVEDTWRALTEGRSGIAPLTAIESPLSSNKGGGQAPDVTPDRACRDLRETTYLRMAITEALQGADCLANLPYPPHRCGILLGTTLHGMRQAGSFIRSNDFAPLEHFLAGDVLRVATEQFGLRGMASSICSACSSGLASIAMAETLLLAGQLDLVVAGGYDPISEYAYGGFNSMRLLTEGRIRNFCRGRDGMKLGEGYGIVVLERERDAALRGAAPLAAVLGFGESCDAYHLSKPHPEGRGAAVALGQALSAANVQPSAVGMVAAHSTATPDNDAAEYAALKTVFGAHLASVPVVAFKSYIGHTLGGAGAVELILSALAIRDKIVPPTIGVEPDEVEFDALSLRKVSLQKRDLRATVNTSLGFGGANTCMVIGPPFARSSTSDKASLNESRLQSGPVGSASPSSQAKPSPTDPVITGIGVILPGAVGNDAFVNLLDRPTPDPMVADPGEVGDEALAGLLEARRVRRMSSYVKLTLAATTLALNDARIERQSELMESCAALLGTNYGSTIYCERYYRQIIEQGIDAANPMLFAEGVPNAAAAHLSTTFGVKGFCQTLIGTRTAGLEGILLAAACIRSGRWDRVLVGAAELIDWNNRMRGKGVSSDGAHIDWRDLMRFKSTFTDPVPRSNEDGYAAAGIAAFHGRARFTDRTTVQVGDDTLTCQYVVIAAGAVPATLGIPGEEYFTTSEQFLELEELPERIVFVGGGYISFEFAHIASRSGADVQLLHHGSRPLTGFDPDLVERLVQATRELGVGVSLNAEATSIDKNRD
ncbi:MAG: FAD-dependent oxidoreductase, partial [Planctomycetes bacterium]|nr:FAD-dependent oxidoreductase [Planctomycetota bacterium]